MEACDVLFLVKNGCGLGHIRRAVLLAKELRRTGISSVVFSQASSLALYHDPDLRVVNFPLIERVKSSAAEEAYTSLLDALAARLDPRLVVEDTYPDSRYLSIPSLRGLPRVLVLRRLDPVSFEHVRTTRGFTPYDRVLIVQDEADFEAERHTPASRRLVHSSGRFTFCGPVFHEPGEAELRQVEADYDLDDRPLVVVTAGSGGDQLNDAYADRLLVNAHRIAATCHQNGHQARFVLVQGPYYRGRQLPPSPNLRVVGFEPRLAALLRRASLVLMRPGHNATYEALGGEAELVFVPGIPWMEGQREFAERLGGVVGATVTDVDDYGALEGRVLEVVVAGERRRRPNSVTNGTARTAAAIASELQSERLGPSAVPRRVLLAIAPPRGLSDSDASERVDIAVSDSIPIVGGEPNDEKDRPQRVLTPLSQLLGARHGAVTGLPDGGIVVDVEMPAGVAPLHLAEMGVLLVLYADEGDVGWRMRRWLASAGSSRPLLVDAALTRIVADERRTRHLGWCLDRSRLAGDEQGLLIDCSRLGATGFERYLGALRDWLDQLQIEPLTLPEFIRERVSHTYSDSLEVAS